MDIWNIVILVSQVVLAVGQLWLSHKINNQVLSREKGYFIIEETNFLADEKNRPRFRDTFDLTSNRGIGFYVNGADVIICGVDYYINGSFYSEGKPYETFYTLDKRFNKFIFMLELKEADKQKEYLDLKIIFSLKNTVGYRYKETVDIRFSKTEWNDMWQITKYNMIFDK